MMVIESASRDDDTAHSVDSSPTILAVDVGGMHVKVKSSAGGEERMAPSGESMGPRELLAILKDLAGDLTYDVVSIGFPAPVVSNSIVSEPNNLATGWKGYDFATVAALGKPVKVVNDALMQAIGSYQGGRMLFLGLGTGLGTAMIAHNVAVPLELGHLPYSDGSTFEDAVSDRTLKTAGRERWRENVWDIVERLRNAMLPEYVVIGGGNVHQLDALPQGVRRGNNDLAFTGGFRLWHDSSLIL